MDILLDIAGLKIGIVNPPFLLDEDRWIPFLSNDTDVSKHIIDIQYNVRIVDNPLDKVSGIQLARGDNYVAYNNGDARYTLLFSFNSFIENGTAVFWNCVTQFEMKEKKAHIYIDEQFAQDSSNKGFFSALLAIDFVLPFYGCIMMHGSVVKQKDEAIIFTGPSGIGKSTQAKLWEKYKNSRIINGDRVVIRLEDDEIVAYGSPWAGSSDIYINEGAPVRAIIMLQQAKHNKIEKIVQNQLHRILLPRMAMVNWDGESLTKCVDIVDKIARRIPVYQLKCYPGKEAVNLVGDTLWDTNGIQGTFELTNRCNMMCKMCYIRTDGVDYTVSKKDAELTAKEWVNLGCEFKKLGMNKLLLTGGEPFLRTDFRQIYEGLKKEGIEVSINTNGTLINRDNVEWLKKMPPEKVHVTLYGKDNETYSVLCNNPGGFDAAIKGIDLLLEAGIQIEMSLSITADNKEELEMLYLIAKLRNIPVKINSYIFPQMRRYTCNNDCYRLPPNEAGKILFQAEKNDMSDKEFYFHMNRMLDEKSIYAISKSGFECGAGTKRFCITYDGKLVPCGLMTEPATYPLRDGIEKSWKCLNDMMDAYSLPNGCKTCSKQHACRICGAMALAEKIDSKMEKPDYVCQMTDSFLSCCRGELDEKKKNN
jgi:MoaA/NifB/PqqE/SkfB family radical SAM enzyme